MGTKFVRKPVSDGRIDLICVISMSGNDKQLQSFRINFRENFFPKI